MCGIAGFGDRPGKTEKQLGEIAGAMAQSMYRRGPDAQVQWTSAEAGIGLSHARLSIIDLSPAGRQPMLSSCGRYVLVYNGEIYNAEKIRAELQREMGGACPAFRGHSDTEVILEACVHWGLEKTVARMIGMFAIALWDQRDRRLVLARDRLGIKPLYWGSQDDLFLFGSELKTFKQHPDWKGEVNPDALSSYLRLNYIPAPLSIFKGVQKLEPGNILVLEQGGEPRVHCYWDLRKVAQDGLRDPFLDNETDVLDQLDELLRDAVGSRMIADVPLGAFLSGGIDSSTVVSLMQAQSARPVQTFSIGMETEGYNEAEHAKAIARHLGTDHTELYISPQDALDVIPKLPDYYDEPFADSSQIPTFLVSQLARQKVTVSLSGDGGDELFTGYNRYFWGDLINRRRDVVPPFFRKLGTRSIRQLSTDRWDQLSRYLPGKARIPQLGLKAHKVADILAIEDEAALFRRLVTVWDNPNTMVSGAKELQNILWDKSLADDVAPFMERMQVLDGKTYLPDDILTKVDRASMAVSLEARVPLLDHRVAEFAFRLPRHMRVRNGQGKWALREILARYVPRELFERPKMGFGIPIGNWLKGELRDWCEELLSPEALEADGLLDAVPIRTVWERHLAGKQNHEVQLWTVLMYQSWRHKWLND